MLSEKIFLFAKYADQVVLTILMILSVVSVAMILERFLFLNKIFPHFKPATMDESDALSVALSIAMKVGSEKKLSL